MGPFFGVGGDVLTSPLVKKNQRKAFSTAEDLKLTRLVQIHGQDNKAWETIALYMNDRSARACRERWRLFLSPGLTNGPWSHQEDSLLIKLFKEIGPKWKNLSAHFNGRSECNVKNRWMRHLRQMLSEEDQIEIDEFIDHQKAIKATSVQQRRSKSTTKNTSNITHITNTNTHITDTDNSVCDDVVNSNSSKNNSHIVFNMIVSLENNDNIGNRNNEEEKDLAPIPTPQDDVSMIKEIYHVPPLEEGNCYHPFDDKPTDTLIEDFNVISINDDIFGMEESIDFYRFNEFSW